MIQLFRLHWILVLKLLCHQFCVIQSSEICMQFGFQTQGFMTGSDLLIKVRMQELSY
jgi:hypothetical protein